MRLVGALGFLLVVPIPISMHDMGAEQLSASASVKAHSIISGSCRGLPPYCPREQSKLAALALTI